MGEITLLEALKEYQNIYMPARNLAERTRIEYANDLRGFIDFLAKEGINIVGDLRLSSIDQYLAGLDSLGISGSTRKRKAITFRSFLSFLYRSGYISHDISSQLIVPFPDQSIPRFLTQGEYQKLLLVCSKNLRVTAITTLLLQTGIRLSELTHITLQSITIDENGQGDIQIKSRDNRLERIIPLNSKVVDALKAYLQIRPDTKYPSLFLNRFGKPLGNRGVQKILGKYFQKAGLWHVTPHSLRHTFGVHHLIKGTNMRSLQKILGHKDIRSTEIYIPLANELSRREMQNNAL